MLKIGIIILVVAIIVIVGGAWWYSQNAIKTTETESALTSGTDINQTEGQTSGTVSKGTTNASLDQDLASIDVEIQALGTDSASIDQGLNDKPVSQVEF